MKWGFHRWLKFDYKVTMSMLIGDWPLWKMSQKYMVDANTCLSIELNNLISQGS